MSQTRKLIFYSCLFFTFFHAEIYSQNQISFGMINNGSGRQSNSDFIIRGTIGGTGVNKSSAPGYQSQSGFWYVFSRINYPATIALNADYSFGDITKTSSYKIIGIPGSNDVSIAELISGTEGKKGDWRAFSDSGSGAYKEYDGSADFDFTPGKAFWVISKNPLNISRTVNTVPLSLDNSYAIPLHQGWNLISNPFEKPVDWNNVKSADGVTQPLNDYQSGSYNSSSGSFDPYKGYYFYNSTNLTDLIIPYPSGTLVPVLKTNAQLLNTLELILVSGKDNKSQIKIGFTGKNNSNPGLPDIYAPPWQFCDINISIYDNNLGTDYKYLSEDYRQEIGDGQEFKIIIKNTSGGTVQLIGKGLQYFNNYEVYLLDESQTKFYNLKNLDGIEINNFPSDKVYGLFIGTDDYINSKKKEILPTEFNLFQNYPNPFNPETIIKFALPVKSTVSLNIYNILGELVANLINNQVYDEGYHEILFNGSSLASGVYFYRIETRQQNGEFSADKLPAGNFTSTKKMLLIK